MKLFRKIFGFASALVLSACSSEDITLPDIADNDKDTFTVTLSIDVPPMSDVMTRTMGDNPDYGKLHLYLLEFDRNGDDPLDNFFVRSYEAVEESKGTDPDRRIFKVSLKKEATPKVLHLIAVNNDETLTLIQNPLAEGIVIPQLTTSGTTDAYWQRIDLPDGYGVMTGTGDNLTFEPYSNLAEKFTKIPMIRNFASIEVTDQTGTEDDFTLLGFYLINSLSAGSVAPWNAETARFEPFIDDSNAPKSYDSIIENYKGFRPANSVFNDRTASIKDEDFTDAGEKIYTFENPYTTSNATRLYIKGNYKGEDYYYKIDLGKVNSDLVFENYSLLRNFAYNIKIHSVGTEGYKTLQEATNGSVFNNLSFDVETRHMLNISDGKNLLEVNFTRKVITQSDSTTFTFGYRLRRDISSSSPRYGTATVLNLNTNNNVITEVSDFPANPDANGWYYCTIKTVDPGTATLTHKFTVIDNDADEGTGLARQVEITVCNPFEVTGNAVYAGNYNLGSEFPYGRNDLKYVVKNTAGQPLTVFFTIPENLPESIFPIEFEFESDQQNIENNKVDNLVVKSGISLFNDKALRIKYVKTVTWNDYNTILDAEHQRGTMVSKKNNSGQIVDKKGYVIQNGDGIVPDNKKDDIVWLHHLRARFLTTTASNDNTTTTIRISCPYFLLGTPDFASFTAAKESDIAAPTVGTLRGLINVQFTRSDMIQANTDPISIPNYSNDYDDPSKQ